MTPQSPDGRLSRYRILSWGCGAPSTTLGVMSALGHLQPLDAIITADTGWERQATYEAFTFYSQWFQDHGIPVHVVTHGDIRQLAAKEHAHMPFWTATGGPLKRQCTREFKIRPIRRKARELIGFLPSLPPNPPAGAIEQWLGFTWEEVSRLKRSDVQFITNRHPHIENRWTRLNCETFLASQDLPVPVKSACVGCPYRTAAEYLHIRQSNPQEFRDAVSFDQDNRHNPLLARGACTADQIYIYKNPITQMPEPLATADLEAHAALQARTPDQLWLDMCDGPCGT